MDSLGDAAKGSCEFAERRRGGSGCMAQHLAMVEQQTERVGQQPDRRQDHQSPTLVRGGLLQVRIRRDRLKNLRIDPPPAATELVKEQRRNGTQFQIARVEVGGDVLGRLYLLPGRNGFVFHDDP